MKPGDILLVQGNKWEDKFIRFGQRLRGKKQFAKYTHVALVVDESCEVIEAVHSGVRINCARVYAGISHVVTVPAACTAMQDNAVAFAQKRLGDEYGWLAIVTIGLFLLTGGTLNVTSDNTYICSQLVGEALTRLGVDWDHSTCRLTPADIAEHFKAPSTLP